jgi:hypothetical protein
VERRSRPLHDASRLWADAAVEARLRRISFSTWLEEQMEQKTSDGGTPRYSTFKYPPFAPTVTVPPVDCNGTTGVGDPTDPDPVCFRNRYSMFPVQNWFFREALYGEDQQLRRRVSWALSQIFVVGGRETEQSGRMIEYVKIIDQHAFGNFRFLLRDVTLSPAMGNYLDMARSTQQNPNENYAREVLQLFSVGVDMLNQDGTPQLNGQGARIPTYTQETVNNFTKVFTGWTFCTGPECPNRVNGVLNYIDPMAVNPANHDNTEKVLFNGTILPAGQTPAQDLSDALDNIFAHPNVGPFISKLLIQQLVTSNPTPAYVGRVAAKFNDNGSGVRGDLKAVVRAILLDPEARGNVKTDPDYGHLREPGPVRHELSAAVQSDRSGGCSCELFRPKRRRAESRNLASGSGRVQSAFGFQLLSDGLHHPGYESLRSGIRDLLNRHRIEAA